MPTELNSALTIQRLPTIVFVDEAKAHDLVLATCEARVAALASAMRAKFRPGDRVGLLYPSEPILVLCWLAALSAGLEPLIMQFPNEKQNLSTWRSSIHHSVRSVNLAGFICAPELEWLNVDLVNPLYLTELELLEKDLGGLAPMPLTSALLQMSSGTTGHRKAIRFTIDQVASHVKDYDETMRLGSGDKIVSWLPLYHDMGLIACFVMPLMRGIPIVMMDPMVWVREPKRLFRAIQTYAATTCYMPNFGFEVMAKHGDGKPLPTMRRWISCSEPVYPATMERFAKATRTPIDRLSACYAMAENVFAVSQRDGFQVLEFDGRPATSCGRPISNTRVKVVDGEIWVNSPSSLSSYVDGAPITDSDGYYPTGDLGGLVGDELVVVGRRHDLVNVAGTKILLNDLDQALSTVMPTLHGGRLATLARKVPDIGTEIPLFLVEDRDFYMPRDLSGVRARLTSETDLESFSIERVPPGFLTKTSSGKVNRSATLANYEIARQWREEINGKAFATSFENEFARLFGSLPFDKPVSSLLDSLGLVLLEMMLEDAGLKLAPNLTLQDHLGALQGRQAPRAIGEQDASLQNQINIVSLADSRTISNITEAHLERLSKAAGLPVTLEHVCLPPSPIVLTDLIFFDYFLPRNASDKYDAVVALLSKVHNASLLLVDDVAELLFGQFAYPALNHRFERSSSADLLIWRWQQYTQHHHELPISVVNLWNTQAARNEFISRLSQYLKIPIFRIAALKSFAEITVGWEFVERANADWTMEIQIDTDALVSRLASFIERKNQMLPRRVGSVSRSPHIFDSVHFCCMFIDRNKIEEVLQEYARFCLIGTEASAQFIPKRIRELGKKYILTANLNLRGQGLSDDQFDCVLQVGSWGRPDTAKPIFQIFDAGWDPGLQPGRVGGREITDRQWFHARPPDAPNDFARENNVLWPISHPGSTDSKTWKR